MKNKQDDQQSALPVSLRRFVYVTAAITGAAIMIVEILGAKMLAPFVGTSHFVWTAQIAVTLVALATGYYCGGRLVDRSPNLRKLYVGIIAASIYLASTVMVVEPLAYWCLKFKLATGSLLASLFLFFVPLSLLAMTGPFFVRVITESVSAVGSNTGRLTSISTLGSVAGTVLIGYVLIPFLPNSVTMYITAAVLMLTGVIYFLVYDRTNRMLITAAMLAMLIIGVEEYRMEKSDRLHSYVSLFKANSNFGELQVLDSTSGTSRYYINDFLVQNTYDPTQKKSMSAFAYLLHDLSWAYMPRIEKALCIGMGMGIVPMRLVGEGVKVDVVEINPAVPSVAKKYFDCDIDRFNLVIGDGRYFINQAKAQDYDVVILDAFLGDSIPSHLFSREAFSAIKRILKPEGVLIINSFGAFEEGRDFAMASMEKTLREGAGFRNIKIHASGDGNVFFVASCRADLKIIRQPAFDDVHSSCLARVKSLFLNSESTKPEHGIVLTDDFNPLEYHDAVNREETRRWLALNMKNF
ncbi:MAG: fused MFS/spermidine synthase [Kiritimatiellae bacterium]|nr:fused MFS/spermidine synthase [Kiritimatiellia bacterium]MDD5520834.1 fused MFS/spermidine synthase [Kiritimatiellia bacterium]